MVTVMTFSLLPLDAFARTYKSIVAFGDSLTDNGNLKGLQPNDYPRDIPITFTDGDTWVQYLANMLDATLDNHAYGSAMTYGCGKNNNNNTNVTNIPGRDPIFANIGLIGQVKTYIEGKPIFTPSETLFTIWIGANDFLGFAEGVLKAKDGTPIVPADPNNPNDVKFAAGQAIRSAMVNISTAIKDLHRVSAVNIIIMNLPNLGWDIS